MGIVSISVLFLLFSHCVTPTTIVWDKVKTTPSILATECKDDSECPCSDVCSVCPTGWGPECETSTCIRGRCGTVLTCSQPLSDPSSTVVPTTTSPALQCSGSDTSRCITNMICARCLPGYSPGCTEAVCVNGQCKVTSPCSIYTPTTTASVRDIGCRQDEDCPYPEVCATQCAASFGPLCTSASCVDGKCAIIRPCSVNTFVATTTTTTVSILPTTPGPSACQTDGQCAYVKRCVAECQAGLQPLCAYSRCIGGQCVVTAPCSQKTQCTEIDTSQCIVPAICADCLPGFFPGCAEASCDNGECKLIKPCTIPGDPPPLIVTRKTTTKTTPRTMVTRTSTPMFRCTRSSQCPRRSVCVSKCSDGMTPLCASAKCVKGRCIDIEPCSQRICKTAATCPFNAKNCAACTKGYGPACEQAACKCGVCSIIAPCSKQLITMSSVQAVVDI